MKNESRPSRVSFAENLALLLSYRRDDHGVEKPLSEYIDNVHKCVFFSLAKNLEKR